MNSKPSKPKAEEAEQSGSRPFCGIIMPIAAMPNYEKSHWDRVRIILDEAIAEAGYTPRLVSESEDIGVIHASIVQNLFDDPIVVCDVSAKNPNVMFELGMRLAFDKPTIIIKDDRTDYSFDPGPIKHINYRADLRFDDVREFKGHVAGAITATVAKKENDASYSPFLGHFHRVKVTNLETTEISSERFIIEHLKQLQTEISRLSHRLPMSNPVAQDRKGMLVSVAMARNLASTLLHTEEFDLSSDLDVLRFVDRLDEEMRNRGLNIPDLELNNIVSEVVKQLKAAKTKSGSLF